MAAIAGWIASANRPRRDESLGAMAAALAHRVAGGETLVAVLEANRDSQIAVAATLRDACSGISLALDGPLANARELRAQLEKRGYRFAGESPSEVLLRAYQYWDKDVVKQLRGAFAFALWDGRKDRLLLARDRFGAKPLYLHEAPGALHFASEPKALLRAGVPAKLDSHAVWDCLAHRYTRGPRTLFQGIRKLAPASYAIWQFGRLREVRYWMAPDGNARVGQPHGDAVDGFLHALDDAVKAHASNTILLSGGIDSAVLAAVMSRQNPRLHSITLGIEGDARSELPYARAFAKHFGTVHHEIVVGPRELVGDLPKLVAFRDAPVSRASDLAMHRLACEAARVTESAVSGDGCDEVLAGYRRYLAAVRHVPKRLFAPLVRGGRFDTLAAELKLDGWRSRLGKPPHAPADLRVHSESDDDNTPLRRTLYRDQSTWLPDQVLERTDRVTMAASLQIHMPFIDHRLAEYVSSLPDGHRVRRFQTKWILHAAADRLLPVALRRRPKAGWRLDVGAWLRNELKDYTLDHLRSGRAVTREYYDAAALDHVIDSHLQGKKNYETLLWTLLNIEIWHRTYSPG